MHGVVPHTCKWYFPTLVLLNIVKKLATSYTCMGVISRILAVLCIADRVKKLLFCFWAMKSVGITADDL